jgi:hypothetical protein
MESSERSRSRVLTHTSASVSARKRKVSTRSTPSPPESVVIASQIAKHTRTPHLHGDVAKDKSVERVLAEATDALVLADVRIAPSSGIRIDLAISDAGVWVIGSKECRGKKITFEKALVGAPKLRLSGHSLSKLMVGLAKQVAAVEAVVSEIGFSVSVQGCLCFLDAKMPLLPLANIEGLNLLWPQALVKRVNAYGGLTLEGAAIVAELLAQHFPQF